MAAAFFIPLKPRSGESFTVKWSRFDSRALFGRALLFVAAIFSGGAQAQQSAPPLHIPPPPAVAARSHVLLDFYSGRVLAQNQSDTRVEPASLTKLMTAYLVFGELRAGRLKLQDLVPVSEHAWRMEGSRTFLDVNTRVPVETLIKGMIVQSGNDATVALAEAVGGTEEGFVNMMNHAAQRLGMKNSHFMNAAGMPDAQHYTTARDMALLARALVMQHPDYYKYYSIREFMYNNITQANRNTLMWRDPSIDGIKTGHTESAGYCLVASGKRGDMRLISVVMGTVSDKARADESAKLLEYGFRFYESRRVYAAGQPLTGMRVWKGESDEVRLGLAQPLYLTLPRGQYQNLKASISVAPTLMAPIKKGQKLGTLNVNLGAQKIAALPLVALEPVPEGGLFARLSDTVRLWFE